MEKFLVKYDFQTLIDEDNLNELSDNNDRLVEKAIDSAVEKVAGYIRHRYDFAKVFKAVKTFSITAAYTVDDRIFWSPNAYQETTYIVGEVVSYQDNIYQCNTPVTAGEPFDSAKWTLLAENNTFYTCIADTTAGILPTDTNYFTAGDNRNPLIVEYTVDIVLYNIHSKISPRAIPDVRRTRYDGFGNLKEGDSAIASLIQVQKGNVTLDLPVIEPTVQNTERVAYGSSPSSNFSY
jgi:hypothetical protein